MNSNRYEKALDRWPFAVYAAEPLSIAFRWDAFLGMWQRIGKHKLVEFMWWLASGEAMDDRVPVNAYYAPNHHALQREAREWMNVHCAHAFDIDELDRACICTTCDGVRARTAVAQK